MDIPDGKDQASTILITPLIIIVLTALSIGTFFIINQYWMEALFNRVEIQHRQSLTQIVSVARHAVEPELEQVRSGKLSRAEGLQRVRSLVRTMTYMDQYGKNYVFMSTYDGIMLVQPFEPWKEMTNQWDLRDTHGLYIIRELSKAAKTHPAGSFVKYYYKLPGVHATQEKLAYVVGLPELGCYIGTGMYMQRSIQEQIIILKKVKYGSIMLLISVFIPISVAVMVVLNRNRRLQTEVRMRRETEEDLLKSEAKYRSIFENAAEGIYQTAFDDTIMRVNPALARMHGYDSPEEMLGHLSKANGLAVRSEDRAFFFRRLQEEGVINSFEMEMHRKDGSVFWVSLSAWIVKDAHGIPLYFEGIVQDITERRQAEEALRTSEEKFARAFQACPTIMGISTLRDGRFLDVNESFLRELGYRREEVIGRSAHDLNIWVDPSDRDAVVQELMKSGMMRNFEFQYRDKRGGIHSGINSTSLITVAGEPCVLVQILDITEHKRLEGQLLQAQKMEAVGQLAGGVAHDFNNLLQAILGYLELVLMGMQPTDAHYDHLVEIKRAGERAAALTRQLLAFSRRQVLQLAPLDVNQIVTDLLQMLRRLIGEDIELVFIPCPSPASVRADKGQIEQVLTNLCVNARDAMPGGGRLIIETANVMADESFLSGQTWARPGRYLRISVTDSGCGMDKETLPQIFEPFFTTKEKHKGTGLGLAMVYGIIRQHQGMVKVYSEVDQGTCFKIYLPAETSGQDDDHAQTEQVEAVGGTETIILAEDEEQIRALAHSILTQAGYRVFLAADGQEALEVYRAHADEITLLFLDVVMPKMGGRAVYDAVKAVAPTIKCLFASGYSQDKLHTDYILEQGLRLLQKPYTRSDLLRLIRQVLDKKS